jgi:DNA polymerase-3 subunit delta
VKLEPRRIEGFLRDPGSTRIVLLHGEDHGLIRDRARLLVKAVAGNIDDPFDVVELDSDSLAFLPAEMMSQSLTGRRRVIRVREAGDAATEHVKRALAGPGRAFAVLEAGGLPPKSKLRLAVEQAEDAQAIACYPVEAGAAAAIVVQMLRDASVTADDDAIRFLCETVTGDQALLRRETEKLALLVGAGARADLDAAVLSVGDLSGLSVEDALFAATSGDVARTDRALETALTEGATPVGVLRGALMHVHRLLQVRVLVVSGVSVGDAVKRLRPPLYFRRVPAFSRAVAMGTPEGFEAVARYLTEAERGCKRTGAPADALARGAILTVARRFAAWRRA